MTLETSLETRGCAHLLSVGAYPAKRGQDGEPDRQVLWGNCRHFWIEFKSKTGRLRPGQKVFVKYLRAIGDEVYVVDAFEDVQRVAADWASRYGPATAFRDAAFR